MRYFFKTDVIGIKEMTMGLVTFNPVVPASVGSIFYIHLFLVCSLFAYFPLSKLMHMAGVFLSPTRNLANNNRAVRHVNPWNYPVKVHTYEEYENDFREKMKAAGLPVEIFKPVAPASVGSIFYIHLFLVCSLFAYFPLSKLMHMAGVFLSPSRNLANNNRAVMHVNPWNYPVKVHTYAEYEDDFRDKMKAAGLPVEKE